LRNITVWLFFIFVPINGHYLDEFRTLQCLGFIILLFGVFVYNEIIVIPFWGLYKQTRAAREL
jgi:hypothetical protein